MNKTLSSYRFSLSVPPLKSFVFLLSTFFIVTNIYAQPICAGDMIPRTTTAIVIDGNIEVPWNLAPRHQITNTVIGTLPAGFVGSQWRALYDNTYLYVLIEVNDDVVMNANHPAWFDDDAVELYIDGDDIRGATYDNNTFQYLFRVTTTLNADPTVHIGGNSVNNSTGVGFAMILSPTGYVVEIRVPWSTININGTSGTPFDGKAIGIDVAVDENDNPGGTRTAQVATYAQADNGWIDPRNFGKNILTVCIAEPLTLLQTSTDPGCVGNTDATIRLNGKGGMEPYSFSINGGTFVANNGYFPGLTPGTYTVAVKDASGTVVNGTPVVIADIINPLSIRADTTLCAGISVFLNGSGSTNGYVWTFSPNNVATAGLNSTTAANPSAAPTVTTTYTVSAQSSANLVPNPGFEAGNVGFYSNYTYYNNPTIARKVYAVTNNPVNLDSYFTSCGDHTTGTGNMMVVDGSAFDTDSIWYQTVPVLANTSYTFSYWIQNVSSPNAPSQARIQTKINGTPLGTANAPVTFACGNWLQITYTWNSVANTTANIVLYDLNVTGIGNDFALDDFYFNSVCPVSKSVTVTVDPAPAAPVVNITQPTCAAPKGILTVTNPVSGATYSFDNGVTFQAGVISDSLPPATYQVIIKNVTGCNSPATAKTIDPPPSAPLQPQVTTTQPTCSVATGKIAVTIPSSGVLYSFDNGINYQPGATSAALVAGNTYNVIVKSDPAGCLSPVLAVTIDPQPVTPVAAFGPSLLQACEGSSFTFSDQSTPAGSIGIGGWTWDFGDGTSVSNQQNPSHTFNIPGNHTVTLSVVSTTGCSSVSSASHVIIIDSLPTAGFTAAVDCSAKSATFTNSSNGNGGTITEWQWNFDDGTGVHVLTNGNTFIWPYPLGGSHAVALIVQSASGCSSTLPFTQLISFGASPVTGFTVGNLCQANGSVTFTNTSTISDGTLMTYTWDFGDATPVVPVTPAAPPAPVIHVYAAGNNYPVTLTATSSGGCAGTAVKQVAIVNIPSAKDSIVNKNNLCSYSPVTVINHSDISGFGAVDSVVIYWDYISNPGNLTIDDAPVANSSYTHQYPVLATDQTYEVRIRAFNVNRCPSPDSIQTITVLASPNIRFNSLPNICRSADTLDLSPGTVDVNGLGGSGIFISGTGVTGGHLFSAAAAGPGLHTIHYSDTASNGCIADTSQTITVKPAPVSNFHPSYSIAEGESITIIPAFPMDPNLTYQWAPSTYLDDITSATPTVQTPLDDITYTVILTSADNCTLDTTVKINLLSDFIVPNTFTPNGDGINDRWRILKIDKYPNHRVEVFNRYGQIVYETRQYPIGGWDGTSKGKSLPFGTYYYIIELGGVQYPKKGYVTIIK